MKITAISDTHGVLPNLEGGDILCICGDIVPLQIQNYILISEYWLKTTFAEWINSLDFKHIIFIAGNHDFVLQYGNYDELLKIKNLHYLKDNSINIDGIEFYGFPWCPVLKNWAFYCDEQDMIDKCNQIPEADILLTHCPPKIGTQGTVLQKDVYNYGSNFGNEILSNRLGELNYKYVLSGHIHSGNHDIDMLNNTKCINVSLKNEHYKDTYAPLVFEI